MGEPAVGVQLTPSAAGFRGGEVVTALLQVSAPQPEAVELQEIEIECSGLERVDGSWVSPAYRAAAPPLATDRRKALRHVFHSRLQAATQGGFADSNLRRFIVRCRTPPPVRHPPRSPAARC